MKITTKEAISRAEQGLSLEDVILVDLDEVRVNIKDALTLSREGIVIPEANVYYNDKEIAFDEDIDGVEWSGSYTSMSWQQKQQMVEDNAGTLHDNNVVLDLEIADEDVKSWLNSNKSRLRKVILPIIASLYQAEMTIRKKKV